MASAAYERRNAAARAKGYRSYYDYRAHGNGSRPPGEPRLRGEALRVARGHAGPADLRRDAAKPGTLVTATPDPTSRRKDGTYGQIHVTAIGEDGSEREYLLNIAKMKPGELDRLIADLDAAGAIISPSPSLDISAYASRPDDDDELDLEGLSLEELEGLTGDQTYDDIPF